MYTKILWNDVESIINDSDYEKAIENESYINDLIKQEIQYLVDSGIELISQGVDYAIFKGFINPEFKVFSTNIIHECDEKGNTTNNKDKNSLENSNEITKLKTKIILNYFREKLITTVKIKEDKNLIIFNCPICTDKNNGKMYIYINSFHVGTHSKTDCTDEKHQKLFKKIKVDLKKLWDNSKEKKISCFCNHADYYKKVIKDRFPSIIKTKNGLFYKYDENEKYYKELVENDRIDELTKLIQDSMFNDDGCLLSTSQLKEAKTYIKHTHNFPVRDFEKCYLYNCKNGVLNLINGELSPHSKDYFFNYRSNIEYNPKADTTKLYNFINAVMTDSNPIELLSKVLGHIHYQGEKLQKGFILKGTNRGRNGKGTMAKLIVAVIGQQRTVTMGVEQFEDSNFSEYCLLNKALYIDDDYKKEYINTKLIGLFNRMISRAATQFNPKGQAFIETNYTTVPILQCNKIPKLKAGDDGGFYDRWIQINFGNSFADCMNEFLGSQLLENKDVMSSLLNLLVNGYRLLLDRKSKNTSDNFFKEDEKNEDWKTVNNPIVQFVNDCCVLGSNYKISSRDLYLYYKCDWNLGGSKLSETKFITMIKDKYHLESKVFRINKKQVRCLLGIACDEIINDEVTSNELI